MSTARNFYYHTFAKAALLPYIGGTVLHLVRLISRNPEMEIPFEVDYFIVLVGSYAGMGFLVFWKDVPLKTIGARILQALVAFHLLGSVILHARAIVLGNHDLFAIFSYEYSYFAVVYFVVLGSYCFVLQRRIAKGRSKEADAG